MMLIALTAIGGTYGFGVLGTLLGPIVLKEIQALVSRGSPIETDETDPVE